MCVTLSPNQVPVADSMIKLAGKSEHPFQGYLCYWTAFNNIYATVARNDGIIKPNGTIVIDGITMPKVKALEREQIEHIYKKFCSDLKHCLIMHESTEWFANRTPVWLNQKIEKDPSGSPLNGVLNVGYTLKRDAPRWSPINAKNLSSYRSGQTNLQDFLAEQILWILYTVRNNLVHAGKVPDDSTDCEVVEKAFPLLRMILLAFLPNHSDFRSESPCNPATQN